MGLMTSRRRNADCSPRFIANQLTCDPIVRVRRVGTPGKPEDQPRIARRPDCDGKTLSTEYQLVEIKRRTRCVGCSAYITTRTAIHVQHYTFSTTRTATHVQYYTYSTTRTALHVQHYTYSTTRTALHVQHYTYNTTRTALHVQHYTYSTTRTTLHVQHYTYNTTRTALHVYDHAWLRPCQLNIELRLSTGHEPKNTLVHTDEACVKSGSLKSRHVGGTYPEWRSRFSGRLDLIIPSRGHAKGGDISGS
ncbi:hypothetical protein Bbelb_016890 [Branchiostoma belcheri]|nr:hypothetical protein Bbelb_016890 [Branchiostoma belcheri]